MTGQLCASQSRRHWVVLGSEDAATAHKCKGRLAQGQNTRDASWASPQPGLGDGSWQVPL